jgi:hypothetical protein
MALNPNEAAHYALAEAAASGTEVGGIRACPLCEGCGLRPSKNAFMGWKKVLRAAFGYAEIRLGVDLCGRCKGTGRG